MRKEFQTSAVSRQALLLFVQEYRKDRKRFGFGSAMDRSVHLALQHRTFGIVREFEDIDLIVVQSGEVPAFCGARYLPQRGTDFNARFLAALQDTFALGYERVVVLGGDIPTLSREDIAQALQCEELVIGPTYDGGFYLAALHETDLPLFDQLPWRQRCLLDCLAHRVKASGISLHRLVTRRDIDHAGDARNAAALLLQLVKEWLGIDDRQLCAGLNPIFFPLNRIPEPRLNSLPPPRFP